MLNKQKNRPTRRRGIVVFLSSVLTLYVVFSAGYLFAKRGQGFAQRGNLIVGAELFEVV